MLSLFRFKTIQRVSFDDLDAYKVVHNSNYFRFFERGRVEYHRNLEFIANGELGLKNIEVAVVENYCAYRQPAYFDDILAVHLRISFIKRSSLQFQYIIERQQDNAIIAYGYSNLVKVSGPKFKVESLRVDFRDAVHNFEEGNLGKMVDIPAIEK